MTYSKCTFSENRPSRSELNLQVAHKADPTLKLMGFFTDESFCGIVATIDCYKRMKTDKVHRAIVVAKGGFTSSAIKLARDMAPEYILEQFVESTLVPHINDKKLIQMIKKCGTTKVENEDKYEDKYEDNITQCLYLSDEIFCSCNII